MSEPYVVYRGDGSRTDFDFAFPYLFRDHVRVLVGGVDVDFEWLNDSLVRVEPAPVEAAPITIRRDTPTVPVYVIQDNRPIPAKFYNTNLQQALYVAEERLASLDLSLAEIGATAEEITQARADALQAVEDARAAAAAALSSEDVVRLNAANALASEVAARSSEVAAAGSAGAAAASSSDAGTHAASALTARSGAEAAKALAEAARDAAGVARTGAETARDTASSLAITAGTHASAAAASAALANGMPLGTIMHFAADTPPSGWLVCNGTAVTTLYPDLRQFLLDAGSPYGTSGGNPRLPDLRGEFVRGWDGGRGVDPGRVFGSAQGDAIRNITGTFDAGGRLGPKGGTGFAGAFAVEPGATSSHGNAANDSRVISFDVSRVVPTAAENRPRNIALLPCIRAYASVVNVPGQADLDNILQQTQVQVDDAVTWRQVAYVPVTATAAVTLTGLDFDGETLILLSGLSPNAGTGNFLYIARSADNGATWDTAFRYSVTADWVTNSLIGSFLMRKTDVGSLYLDGKTSAANQAAFDTIYQTYPITTTFGATTNALRFTWSGTGRDFVAGGYIAVLKRG